MSRIGQEEIDIVVEVLKSGELSSFYRNPYGGKYNQLFEEAFAEYIGVEYAIAVSNGTTALQTAYLACELGSGDEVITTPLTFVATASMICAVGATPVFVDVDFMTYNIDSNLIEYKITDKTKAIVLVHLLGNPCRMDQINEIAEENDLWSIEDACQSFGSRYNNVKTGKLGDIACFDPRVIITTKNGQKKIKDIKIGEDVLTEDGFHKVTELHKREYYGGYTKIWFGKKTSECRLTATNDHPIKVWRNNIDQWIRIKEIKTRDYIYVLTHNCLICDKKIPFYHKLCPNCNPSQLQSARDKQSKNQSKNKKRTLRRFKHYYEDIVPYASKLEEEGWRVIPIGVVIPDIIGIKNGKVVAFEIENKVTPKQRKVEAYEKVKSLYDEIRWITFENHPHKWKRPYEIVGELARVPVIEVEFSVYRSQPRKKYVYNLTVEGSPTFFAKRVLVHNCFSFQETKQITSGGEGGMITTDNDELAEKCKRIRNNGAKYFQDPDILGYNFRMTEIQAAIGLVQLRKLDIFNERQINNAKHTFKNLPEGIYPPYVTPNGTHSYYICGCQYNEVVTGVPRTKFLEEINNRGINKMRPSETVSGGYSETVPQLKWFRIRGFTDPTPKAERLTQTSFYFDNNRYPHTTEDMDHLTDSLKQILEDCQE